MRIILLLVTSVHVSLIYNLDTKIDDICNYSVSKAMIILLLHQMSSLVWLSLFRTLVQIRVKVTHMEVQEILSTGSESLFQVSQ